MIDRTENMRRLVDMAVQSGRKRQNNQTGYIHHCYTDHGKDCTSTIPLVENFLFALALLRSRTVEQIGEAKELLNKLLYFQNHIKDDKGFGNFPIYLHEYPQCKDRFTGVPIAVALYWTLKLFSSVLGSELKGRLEESLTMLLFHMMQTHAEKQAPYPIALKIAAVCQVGGALVQQASIQRAGEQLIAELSKESDQLALYSPAQLGGMLSALSMLYPSIEESPWKSFWKHLENTWHQGVGSYAGPSIKEFQEGREPQVTLYDLFLGYFSGSFSARALKDSLVHLEAALIPPFEGSFQVGFKEQKSEVPGDGSWNLYAKGQSCYCFIDTYTENNGANKGFHLLRMMWGSLQRVHTFVCQGSSSQTITSIPTPNGVDLFFHLDQHLDTDDREKNREAIFFLDLHDDLDIRIAGQKATTFSLGEELTIKSGDFELSLVFELEKGEGVFLGHCMRGNRPSQLLTKGENRYDAYDWQLFMRTVKRSLPCVIKASLQIK